MSNETILVPSRDVEVRNIRQELVVNAEDVLRVQKHREVIKSFIREVLVNEVDYTDLDGKLDKKFLTKPGAEKLKMLFGLGVRFREVDKIFDRDNNFLLFSHEAEIYHLKTGIVLATCIGSCNSQEKKYRERSIYEGKVYIGKEPTPIYDIYNTICKQSQKRGFVGGTIIATNASDYFTQDEEEVEAQGTQQKETPSNKGEKFTQRKKSNLGTYKVLIGTHKGKMLKDIPRAELENYINYMKNQNDNPSGPLKELIDKGREYLRELGE